MAGFFARAICLLGSIAMLATACVPAAARMPVQPDPRTIIGQGRDLVASGDLAGALDLLGKGYQARPESDLLEAYREALSVAKAAADLGYQRKDFTKAGVLYRALLDSVLLDTAGAPRGLERSGLERQMKECSRILTERGLEKYREENLDEAVAVWKKVLAFDPGNSAVLKAIETASRQRKRLQTIN